MDVTPIDRSWLPPGFLPVFDHASEELTQCGFECVGFIQHHAAQTCQTPLPQCGLTRCCLTAHKSSASELPASTGGMKHRDHGYLSHRVPRWCVNRYHQFTASVGFSTRPNEEQHSLPGYLRSGAAVSLPSIPCRPRRPPANPAASECSMPYITLLQMDHTETFQRLIGVGYYAMDSSGKHYVPTLKGAYLMTYRLLPPFRQIQNFLKNQACERALRESGFEGMQKFEECNHKTPQFPHSPGFDLTNTQ